MHIRTAAITLIALSGALTAQTFTTKVIPASAESFDGNARSAYPFAYQSMRMQEIFSGSAICTTQAALTGIKMRIELDAVANAGPFSTAMTVELGHTSVTPANISSTYASNITSSMTQVFNGTINLPSQAGIPAGAKAGSFNINVCVLTNPYIYTAAQGDLLMDITTALPNGKSSYFVDAATSGGTNNEFGVSGQLSSSEPLSIRATGPQDQAIPGGSMQFTTSVLAGSFPGELMIGVDDSSIFGVPLPFDLGPFGAPSNSLYIASIASVPHNFIWAAPGGYNSVVTLPIPTVPSLVGGRIFAQPYAIDAPANAAGIVMGNAASVRIGGKSNPPMAQVGHWDIVRTSGDIFNSTRGKGGAVVEFTGIFQ